MWLQRFTHYLLQHRYPTIAFAFLITFIPIIGIFGILIAALVTLRKGIVEGAIVTVAASLPYVISFFVSVQDPSAAPFTLWTAMGVAILSNVLTWVFACMLLRQMSWSGIVQVAALLGVLVVSVVHLAYPDIANWWGKQLQIYAAHAQAVSAALKTSAANTNDVQLEALNTSKQYATGVMAVIILLNALFQVVVARWWQAIMFAPKTLRVELQSIRLSQLAGVLFVISLALSYWGNAVVLDVMPILYVLFCAAGLSLVHYLFGLMQSQTAWLWLCLLYVTLILSIPLSVVVIAMFALMDIWLDFRKRFRRIY